MTDVHDSYYAADCRQCGREVVVGLSKRGGPTDGVRGRCAACGRTNWLGKTHWEFEEL